MTPRAASDATRTILLPFDRIGSNCWTRKKGARTLTAKSRSKSSMVVSSMVADFETPPLATRISRQPPTMSRASLASCRDPSALQIGRDGVATAAGFAYLVDDTVGFV